MTFTSTQLSLGEFCIRWLISKKSSLKNNTWSQYDHTLKNFILPILGNVKIRDLRPDHIQSLYDDLLANGIGIYTVLKIHDILHSALSHASDTKLIQHNPANSIILPKEPESEMKILDESQVSQMLITAQGNRLEALYYLALTTGMRQSEILGLKWIDIDWQNQTLRIERQLVRPKGSEVIFAPPKTKFGKRTVKIGEKSISILRNHDIRQNQERIISGDRWIDKGLLFTTRIGTPIHARNLIRYFKKLLNEAGLPEIRFHDLRHTAASIMLNNGIPVIVVSRRLGHSKPSITLDVYGHLIPSMDEYAAQRMDELVTPVELHQTAPKLHQE